MAISTSLRRAFTTSYLLVASLPVLLLGLSSIHLVSDRQLEGVQERNMQQTISIAEEVDRFLLEVRADLMHVRHIVDVGSILQAGSLNQFLGGVVANSQFFESIYYLDKNLNVVNLGVMPELEFRRDDYLNLDYSGHQIFNVSERIQDSMWSNTFVSLLTGEPSVTLGLPTKDGFLLGNIRLRSLERIIQRYDSYGEIEVAIIDNNGTLIVHSVKEKAMQRINFANRPVVSQAMTGSKTTGEFKYGSTNYLESAVDILTAQWVVWAGLDMNFVKAPINNLRDILIGFMIVTAIIASIISLFNIRRLLLPITALGQKAGQIAEGRYDIEFRPSGFSEIDALAERFSNMSKAIKVREESIVTNEQRFRDLVNSIDGIVWEMDYPSFRFIFVSQQAESILGYPVQDWYEAPDFWENRVHADDRGQAKAYCQLMAEKQEDHGFEYRMIAADGRIVWIRDLVTVVIENNQPTRLLGVMIDITEQKTLLEELRHSEENYREIFNSTSDAIFIHDADTGKVLDVNQAMMSMFECTYEDALTGEVAKYSLGETPYSANEAMEKLSLAKDQGSCSFEWRSRKESGEVFWTEVYLRSATIGTKPRILAAVRDVTSRKEAAEQLHELNERLVLLIENMPVGCIYWTPRFTVDLWNPAAEKIFGYNEKEMLGKEPYGTIVSEELRLAIDVVWQRLLAGDQSADSVNENLTKDGRVISCEWYNTPVAGPEGDTIGVISMVQDISERKAAEDELLQYRSKLEDLVLKRTRQLEEAQKQLVQKERLAVLGQLTATVSHEIRNPLGTVANSLYLLKEILADKKHEPLQRSLQLAERNVERCDNIISDLLDFSRQRDVERTPVNIDDWLREFLSEIKLPHNVYLCYDLEASCSVPVDVERIRRVLVNVTTNAFQALEEKEEDDKTLTIATKIVGDRCLLEFTDNGPGMSAEVLEKIFEPMFSTKNFGVGLGVPIIKSIVESHGGQVEYQSVKGAGTTVSLWLPLNETTQG